ncbi:hypothetical protein RSW31_24705, partial [Escherichia coli]|nr:hypothetical protein [Escherichia coli]
QAAQRANLPIKGHTEQLTHSGGSALAAKMGALSVDHIEYLNDDDIDLLARHGTIRRAAVAERPFGNSLRGVGWRVFREPERSGLDVREH